MSKQQQNKPRAEESPGMDGGTSLPEARALQGSPRSSGPAKGHGGATSGHSPRSPSPQGTPTPVTSRMNPP